MLSVFKGATVLLEITGHSAVNGASLPEGSTVEVTSNDPETLTIGTIPPVAAGGSAKLAVPVTLLKAGTVDAHAVVTTPDGSKYEATDTIMIGEPEPGLLRIEAVFVEVKTVPVEG